MHPRLHPRLQPRPCKTPFARFAPAAAAICATLLLAAAPSASASPAETVLYAFAVGSGGANPTGGLILDGAGNLYGTTQYGGASGGGVAFKLAATASGLAYSRVSQTFNGTLTLTNVSAGAIDGPLQIFFTGLTAGVTLANVTGALSGTPYLTVPAVASLPAGQSVTVDLQFKDPANAPITFTPAIYSGSL